MRALISVSDKSNLTILAKFFTENGIEMVSTGGTYKYLTEKGFNVLEVSEYTGHKEILNGRVKTLHSKIYGGILFKRTSLDDLNDIKENEILPIDIVCVNFYPFSEVIKENLDEKKQIEYIDIGGVALLRAAAKNYRHVYALSNPRQYEEFISYFKNYYDNKTGDILKYRKNLAQKAFRLSRKYDDEIYNYLLYDDDFRKRKSKESDVLKDDIIKLPYKKKENLIHGENLHQKSAFYESMLFDGFMNDMENIGNKDLSYYNYRNIDAAWRLISEFKKPAAAIIKHSVPVSVALGEDLHEAYSKAHECSDQEIYGSVVVFNREVDLEIAEKLSEIFLDIVIAPGFSKAGIERLSSKDNLKVIKLNKKPQNKTNIVSVDGGILIQEIDSLDDHNNNTFTKLKPNENDKAQLKFASKVAKHCKSSSIVLSNNYQTLGIASGQTNTVEALEIALKIASNKGEAFYLASDGNLTFKDIVQKASENGIKHIIEPGGSVSDDDFVKAANDNKISITFTGIRHYKY